LKDYIYKIKSKIKNRHMEIDVSYISSKYLFLCLTYSPINNNLSPIAG